MDLGTLMKIWEDLGFYSSSKWKLGFSMSLRNELCWWWMENRGVVVKSMKWGCSGEESKRKGKLESFYTEV